MTRVFQFSQIIKIFVWFIVLIFTSRVCFQWNDFWTISNDFWTRRGKYVTSWKFRDDDSKFDDVDHLRCVLLKRVILCEYQYIVSTVLFFSFLFCCERFMFSLNLQQYVFLHFSISFFCGLYFYFLNFQICVIDLLFLTLTNSIFILFKIICCARLI